MVYSLLLLNASSQGVGFLNKYEDLIDLGSAQPAPATSFVVLADVRGSTAEIQAGRYRDVNMVGAACIAAVRNSFSAQEIPYVFGGDGATFLVPAVALDACLRQLASVQRLARENLGLDLRVGHVPVSRIRAEGADLRFGFMAWSEQESLPFFRGDGLRLAEEWIKEQFQKEEPTARGEVTPAMHEAVAGVSCRLEPFAAVRGRVLSILVEPRVPLAEEDAVFEQIFQVIRSRGAIDRLRPVKRENMKRAWLNSTFWAEARLRRRARNLGGLVQSLFVTLLSFILVTALFRLKKRTDSLGDTETYTQALITQSDWIKIDGTLRLVIDASAEEERELRELLARLEGEGKLLSGIYASPSALMTCHYQSGQGQRHVHFIDGSGGGLTLAALELKRKKQELLKLSLEAGLQSA